MCMIMQFLEETEWEYSLKARVYVLSIDSVENLDMYVYVLSLLD